MDNATTFLFVFFKASQPTFQLSPQWILSPALGFLVQQHVWAKNSGNNDDHKEDENNSKAEDRNNNEHQES